MNTNEIFKTLISSLATLTLNSLNSGSKVSAMVSKQRTSHQNLLFKLMGDAAVKILKILPISEMDKNNILPLVYSLFRIKVDADAFNKSANFILNLAINELDNYHKFSEEVKDAVIEILKLILFQGELFTSDEASSKLILSKTFLRLFSKLFLMVNSSQFQLADQLLSSSRTMEDIGTAVLHLFDSFLLTWLKIKPSEGSYQNKSSPAAILSCLHPVMREFHTYISELLKTEESG